MTDALHEAALQLLAEVDGDMPPSLGAINRLRASLQTPRSPDLPSSPSGEPSEFDEGEFRHDAEILHKELLADRDAAWAEVERLRMKLRQRDEAYLSDFGKAVRNMAASPSGESPQEPKCGKCRGAGWVYGSELDEADDATRDDTMTHYTCDWCRGTGTSAPAPPTGTPSVEESAPDSSDFNGGAKFPRRNRVAPSPRDGERETLAGLLCHVDPRVNGWCEKAADYLLSHGYRKVDDALSDLRERCAKVADARWAWAIAADIRALPLEENQE